MSVGVGVGGVVGSSLSPPHEERIATATVPETMPHACTNQKDVRSRLPTPHAVNDVLILRPNLVNLFQRIILSSFFGAAPTRALTPSEDEDWTHMRHDVFLLCLSIGDSHVYLPAYPYTA